MRRRVVWERRASAELADIGKRNRRMAQRISQAVDHFAETGLGDLRKLEGDAPRYRLRVGDFRVIFRFEESGIVILVLHVRNRREAYRD